jgi:hypothetical protein
MKIYNCFCMGEKIGLTLSKEHRLRVLENRALRRIFGPKLEDVTGEWRRLHNAKHYELYYTGKKFKKYWMGGACGMYGRQESCIQGVVREIT